MGPPLRRKWTALITKAFSLIRPCIKNAPLGKKSFLQGRVVVLFDKIAAYR